MEANEFIKKYGWNKARLLLSTQGKTIESLKDEYTPSQLKEFQRYIVSNRLMSIDKLKRLIESNELIEKDFGLLSVAEYEYVISASYSEPYWVRVKQAIKDVESCQ